MFARIISQLNYRRSRKNIHHSERYFTMNGDKLNYYLICRMRQNQMNCIEIKWQILQLKVDARRNCIQERTIKIASEQFVIQ